MWLKRQGRPSWFTWAPMLFVLVVTVWALILQAYSGFTAPTDGGRLPFVNGCVALALLGLASLVVIEALRAVQRPRERVVDSAAA